MANPLVDISSQVLLAATVSEQANEAFLLEQPNFLPDNDAEIVNNLVESRSSKVEGSQEDQVKLDQDSNKLDSTSDNLASVNQKLSTQEESELIQPFGRKTDNENTETTGKG